MGMGTPMGPSFASDPKGALEFFNEYGYQIEPDVHSAAECRELIEASHRLSDYGNGNLTPAMQAHRYDPRFMLAFSNPKIVSIMEMLLSGKVSGLQTEIFYCPPGTPGFSLHQDNFYAEVVRGGFATAWCPLQDVTSENGGLIVYPRSHQLPLLPVEPVPDRPAATPHQDPNAAQIQCVLPTGFEPVNAEITLGCALFIHGFLVHGSNQNRSTDRYRHVFLGTYVRQGEKFRAGNYAKREEVNVYRT